MHSNRFILRIALLAMLLAACSAPIDSPTAGSSASLTQPTPTRPAPSSRSGTPSPQPSFAAMPGLTFDAAQAWADGFDFACRTGLVPPDRTPDLIVALCTRQSASDNAKLDLTIQYWPNNTVLAVSAALQPISSSAEVDGGFRTEYMRWASGLPYAGADRDAVLDFLLSDEACSTGCSLEVGGVSWVRTSASGLDAVSAFVPR